MKPDYGQISDTHILTQKALITKEMKPYSVCYAFIIKPFCCVFHECLFMMCNLVAQQVLFQGAIGNFQSSA